MVVPTLLETEGVKVAAERVIVVEGVFALAVELIEREWEGERLSLGDGDRDSLFEKDLVSV